MLRTFQMPLILCEPSVYTFNTLHERYRLDILKLYMKIFNAAIKCFVRFTANSTLTNF